MEPEKTDPDTARRTRKWATKTRTGCITCRRRRIKCDEAIPSCKRCISTGRDCEGYTIARDTSSIYHQPIPSDAPAGVDASHAERGAFAMLRGDCARRVAGLFSGAFWTVDVLRAAHVYPAVWRAGLAMAAMHRATCVTAPTPAARAARQRHERFALTQSHAAVVALLALTRKPQPLADPDKEAVLLACTLFTGLCCLQEDYEQASQHAKAGNRLYWRWNYWRRSDDEEVEEDDDGEDDGDDFTCTTRDYRADNHGARRPGCVLTTKSLTAVFTHFEMQFCSRFLSIDIPEWRWRDRAHRCSPAPFASAADAYTELQPLLTGYCHMSRWLSVPRADAELATVGRSVAAYAREMLAWRDKFEDLLARRGTSLAALPPPPTGEDEEDEEAHHILCLRLLWMALETCFEHTEATGEMVWDQRTPAFERVTTFAETHFAARWSRRASPSSSPPGITTKTTTTTPPNRTFTFSFAMNACEVLTWIGTNCRDGGVRRRLIALLHGWPERDGMMDARLLALVVHAVMVLEENATTGMQAPHEGCVCKLEEEDGGGGRFICADHRVCLIDTQFLGERSAAIVLTTTGMLRHGLPPYETSVSW